MKALYKALLLAAAATSLFALASCSDDDDEVNESTDYGAAVAIAKIKASSETYAGVSDFYSLTFDDFSNETNDPIILREEDANGNYTYSIASADTVTSDCFSQVGIVKAKDVALWSSEKSGIRTSFNDKTKKFKKLVANHRWISELPTSGTIDLRLVKDFIAVKASGAGTVSASVTNYSITVDTGVAALVDSTGKILDAVTLTAKSDTVTPTAQTLSASVSSSGVYMLIISKNESGGGTVNINSFTFSESRN